MLVNGALVLSHSVHQFLQDGRILLRLGSRPAPSRRKQRVGFVTKGGAGPVTDEPLAVADQGVLLRGARGPVERGHPALLGPVAQFLEERARVLLPVPLAVPVRARDDQPSLGPGQRYVARPSLLHLLVVPKGHPELFEVATESR